MISVVTGATGFIGQYLARALVAAGDDVHALLAEDPEPQLHKLPDGVTGHYADLRQAGQVQRTVKAVRPDRVFHLAAAGVSDPFMAVRPALRVNLDGTLHLLQAVEGRAPVVIARTPGEREAANVYAASKAAGWLFGEMYARTHGWPVFGAMIFSAYGVGQNPRNVLPQALAAARAGQDFPMSPGGQVRDWIEVRDVVDGLIAVSGLDETQRGATVELGTGVGTALVDVVTALYGLVGGPGQPLPGRLPYRPGEVMQMVAEAEQTASLTGWRAQIDLMAGLADLVRASETQPA